ncbi:YqgE/AlgH family protein [Nakamurella lactea]|uniref:YqgE/AlgH family protein n=1 Tax=Nakamurella lactea TaxID=459515 RepID=UPI0003F8F210|nr:YqgE/AlgH family protein [Nakamurella lactea]
MDRPSFGPGSLLVATPSLIDPSFQRTVILLLAHGDDGTLGVVLNRPSETSVQTVLPGWERWVSKPRAMFYGGPVGSSSALCVGVRRAGTSAPAGSLEQEIDSLLDPVARPLARVSGELVLVDLDSDPLEIFTQLRGARVYAGHSGWGAGQLADEIDQGSWYVLDSEADDVLAGPSVDLWFRVLRRQGLPLALAAYQPLEPSLN